MMVSFIFCCFIDKTFAIKIAFKLVIRIFFSTNNSSQILWRTSISCKINKFFFSLFHVHVCWIWNFKKFFDHSFAIFLFLFLDFLKFRCFLCCLTICWIFSCLFLYFLCSFSHPECCEFFATYVKVFYWKFSINFWVMRATIGEQIRWGNLKMF